MVRVSPCFLDELAPSQQSEFDGTVLRSAPCLTILVIIGPFGFFLINQNFFAVYYSLEISVVPAGFLLTVGYRKTMCWDPPWNQQG